MSKNINLIKEANLNTLRGALREAATATKPQLAQLTGLSVVTVNSLISLLVKSGEVLPDTLLNSDGGRPPASFRYNSRHRLALVIYMHEVQGKDTAFYRVIDLRGQVVEQSQTALSNVTVESFDTEIERYIEKYPQIQILCFGIPGEEVNYRLIISDYPNMRNESLTRHGEEKFKRPVLVENDVNAAIMGHCKNRGIDNNQCVIGLYFPDKYPPGAGICMNGDIWRGRNGLAGEIKFLPLGIQWDTFDYNPLVLKENVVKTIQAFSCILNPDRIVLYGNGCDETLLPLLQSCFTSSPEEMLFPEILFANSISSDFEAGIIHLALKRILDAPSP